MHRSPRFPWLVLALALFGCGGGEPSGPTPVTVLGCDRGRLLTIGSTVNGKLESGDCLNLEGTAAADYYQFTITADGPASIPIQAVAGSVPLVITIVDANREAVDFAYIPSGEVSQLGGQFFAGTYVLIVAAEEPARSGGSYVITSSATMPAVFGCTRLTPIAVGATVTGTIALSDCLDPVENANADYYAFTMTAAGPVSFTVTPAGSATMVVGLSTDREQLLDVQVTSSTEPATVGGALSRGHYILIVAGFEPGQTGGYTITSSATLPPAPNLPPFLGCTIAQPYTVGTTANGTLASTDCADSDGTPLDRYDFSLTSSQTVTFNLQSAEFDTFLYLFDADGALMAYNDDIVGSTNSRLTVALAAGSYAIGASGYYTDSRGTYTLSSTASASIVGEGWVVSEDPTGRAGPALHSAGSRSVHWPSPGNLPAKPARGSRRRGDGSPTT